MGLVANSVKYMIQGLPEIGDGPSRILEIVKNKGDLELCDLINNRTIILK